jgi:serine protease Do
MDAKVIGMMRGLDIAVLEVEEKDLDPITIGNSSTLKVGQFALAVGNPLGLGKSVTFGLVSALNRTISAQNAQLEGLIQTTAEINPGNSGGALVNTSAELIGIPTAVIPFSQGIGFAIAIDSVKGLLEEFRETGNVSTPWIGITGYTIDPRIAQYYQLTHDKGALIIQVPKGPAKSAGIEPGDIIIGINNEEINSIQILIQKIVKRRIGEEVKVKYIRNGREFETFVKLGTAPT